MYDPALSVWQIYVHQKSTGNATGHRTPNNITKKNADSIVLFCFQRQNHLAVAKIQQHRIAFQTFPSVYISKAMNKNHYL